MSVIVLQIVLEVLKLQRLTDVVLLSGKKMQAITRGRPSCIHSAQTFEYGPVVGLLEHIYRFIK